MCLIQREINSDRLKTTFSEMQNYHNLLIKSSTSV
jgi:hypothetical protein